MIKQKNAGLERSALIVEFSVKVPILLYFGKVQFEIEYGAGEIEIGVGCYSTGIIGMT